MQHTDVSRSSQALAAAAADTPLPKLLHGVLAGVRRDCGALLAMPEKHETMQVKTRDRPCPQT
jgi:hypothetical protein